MSLSDEQWEFLKDVAKLIFYAEEKGFKLTEGEGYRTQDQQNLYYFGKKTEIRNGELHLIDRGRRLSKVLNSLHLSRLAHDFNIFKDGKLITSAEQAKELGEFWESLNEKNVWGGSWGWDTGHFERNRS